MGTTLTGTTPQDTYDSLIKVTDNGPLSGTAKYLSDGLGNDSALALSTSAVGIGTTSGTSKANILSSTVAQTVLTLEGNYSGSGSVELLEFNRSGGAVSGAIKYQDADTAMAIGTTTSHAFIFNMGDVERMRLTATGAVQIKGSSTTTGYQASIENNDTLLTIYGSIFGGTGKGIAFWPTGAAEGMRLTTNGLTFNGDTAAANALDDYEEGTFTPTISGSVTAGTATYSIQNGRYTKIGRLVQFEIYINWSAGTGAGNLRLSNLPFTSASSNTFSSASISYFLNVALAAAGNVPMAYVENAATFISFVEMASGGGGNPNISYDAAGAIQIAGTYSV